MNIVVLVKQVPDSGLARQLDDQLRVDRNGANNVMGELDEYAVEAALQLKEAHGGEVTVLTLGPGQATDTVRKTLAMGADKAVHVEDDAVAGSDALATSKILAAALGRLEWDLVIAGAESTDSGMGVMPQMLAARTGAPALTGARKIDTDGTAVTVEHQRDQRLRRAQREPPGDRLRLGHHQHPALPVAQGHHGRQAQAGRDAHARRPRRHRRRARRREQRGAQRRRAPRPHRRPDRRRRRARAAAALAEFLAAEKFI